MSMKNIRVLSFSFYPPYANSQKYRDRDPAIGNRGTSRAYVIKPKMSGIA